MLTAIFIAIQLISLAVTVLFVFEYKRISRKHEELVHSIETGRVPSCKLQSTIIIWIYAALMLVILIGSSSIYFSEPTLL